MATNVLQNYEGGRIPAADDWQSLQDQLLMLAAAQNEFGNCALTGIYATHVSGTVGFGGTYTLSAGYVVLAGVPVYYAGGTVVINSDSYLYLDSSDIKERPFTINGMTSAQKAYTAVYGTTGKATAISDGKQVISIGLNGATLRVDMRPSGPVGTVLHGRFDSGNFSGGLGTGLFKGWAICDGNNGTPNLNNKYIKSVADYTEDGDTGGGSNTQRAKIGVAVPTVGTKLGDAAGDANGFDLTLGAQAVGSGSAATVVKIADSVQNGSANVMMSYTFNNEPAYYTLGAIMRMF
jgi:hypothetical protein